MEIKRIGEKALAFDSKDVQSVIEGLDILKARFQERMATGSREYLPLIKGKSDDKAAEAAHADRLRQEAGPVVMMPGLGLTATRAGKEGREGPGANKVNKVRMTDPDGKPHWVASDQVEDAKRHGWKEQ